MNLTRTSRLIPAVAVAALAALALSPSPALASGHSILRADLVGSMPAPDSPVIAGINPGGAPWVNGPSSARVRQDGRIMVSITGLIIPPPRGTNPIPSVVATLVCDDMVRSSTAPFALSPAGDGSTSGRIAGTHRCKDPVLLIQPAANRTVYIASAMGDHDDD